MTRSALHPSIVIIITIIEQQQQWLVEKGWLTSTARSRAAIHIGKLFSLPLHLLWLKSWSLAPTLPCPVHTNQQQWWQWWWGQWHQVDCLWQWCSLQHSSWSPNWMQLAICSIDNRNWQTKTEKDLLIQAQDQVRQSSPSSPFIDQLLPTLRSPAPWQPFCLP